MQKCNFIGRWINKSLPTASIASVMGGVVAGEILKFSSHFYTPNCAQNLFIDMQSSSPAFEQLK